MTNRTIPVLAAALTLLALAPPTLGGGIVPVGPITNGAFEIAPPEGLDAALAGTPADACIGIGHQAYWGSETIQSDLADRQDPEGAAARVADDPEDVATLTTGYGRCVWSKHEGYDLVWLAPVEKLRPNPLQWSFDVNTRSAWWGDYDGDGDREVKVPAGPGSHNFWQAYANPQQAWSANFDALTFRVESGAVPAGALVQVSLSATPLETKDGALVNGIDCSLNFGGALLQADADGLVRASPLDAGFAKRTEFCADLAAAWASGDDAAKADVLGRTRIIQVSFWSFNRGAADVVMDDVEIVGGTTVLEEVARGNANLPLP